MKNEFIFQKIEGLETLDKIEILLNKKNINFSIEEESLLFFDKNNNKITEYSFDFNKDGEIRYLKLKEIFEEDKKYKNLPTTISEKKHFDKIFKTINPEKIKRLTI